MAQARFSIRTAVAEGIEFWRANWRGVTGALALAAVIGVAVQLSLPPADHPSFLPTMLAGVALMSVAQLPAQAALYRLALADVGAEPAERNGPLGLQWRALETQLLAAGVLVCVLLLVVFMVGGFIMLALMAGLVAGVDTRTLSASPEAVMASLSPNGQLILNLFMLAFLVALIILYLRLSLVQAATAAARRTQVFSSMRLTKGALLPIFAVMMVINLPLLLIQFVGVGLAGGDVALAQGMAVILTALSPFFLLPITVGSMAYVYRRLSAAEGQS